MTIQPISTSTFVNAGTPFRDWDETKAIALGIDERFDVILCGGSNEPFDDWDATKRDVYSALHPSDAFDNE